MTLRAYLTLLRPVRTILFAAFYGWAMGFNLLKIFGRLPLPEAAFLTCTSIGPVTRGAFLLGPLHEVMHSSFSPLLPGCRTAFRRWHLVACGLVAVSCLIGTELLGHPFPRAASAGFILAGLAAPLLNRRRGLGWSAMLGMLGYVALVALLALPTRALLLDAGRAFPWAILAIGTAFAAFSVRRGFSAESLRERSRGALLFCCLQTGFPLAGSGGFAVTRYMQTENGRLLAARKANKPGREWTVASVGSSLREWAAVVHHSRFGGVSRGQLALGLLIFGISPLAMIALIQFFISSAKPNHAIRFPEFFGVLATAFHPGAAADLIPTLLYGIGLFFGLAAATTYTASVVLAPYRLPLSRERLARSTLLETHRLTALVAAAFAAELCLLSLGTTLLAGQPFDASVLARPLAATLFLVPSALLIQAFIVRAARHYWLLLAGFAIPLLVGPGVAGALAGKLGARAAQYSPVVLLDAVFTPSGLAIFLAVAILAGSLHWLALRRHFRTCDFSRPLLLVAAGRCA